MQLEQCCSSLWGLSWRNASDQTCLSCTYTLLPGQRTVHTLRHISKWSTFWDMDWIYCSFSQNPPTCFMRSLWLGSSCIKFDNITYDFTYFSLHPRQIFSPPLWCGVVYWAVSGCLWAQPPACPGVEPTTALLTGSTSTSRAAVLTCWQHPPTAPGQSTSALSVMGEGSAVRCESITFLYFSHH